MVRQWARRELAGLAEARQLPTLTVADGEMRLTIRLYPASGPGQSHTLLMERREQLTPQSLAPLGLTPRENSVLLRVIQGKTNRELAAELVLSPRTVQKHLENIFWKLGVDNRAAAVGRALELLTGSVVSKPEAQAGRTPHP